MRIVEVFQSIDGEALRAGQPANFIRLAGCNLRCSYCDTRYASSAEYGVETELEEVLAQLNPRIKNVTLTGGEPLLHKADAEILLAALLEEGYNVSVETNGSINLKSYIEKFPEVSFVMDYKLPLSYAQLYMDTDNFKYLRSTDAVKFVAGSLKDLNVMENVYNTYLKEKVEKVPIFLSPVFGCIEPRKLVEYILQRELYDIRVQIQLHKVIWEPDRRGV